MALDFTQIETTPIEEEVVPKVPVGENNMSYKGPDQATTPPVQTFDMNKTGAPLDFTQIKSTPIAEPVAEVPMDPVAPAAPKPTAPQAKQMAEKKAEGVTDYAYYHNTIAPAYAQHRKEYIDEFADTPEGVNLEEANTYAKTQTEHQFGVDQSWMDQAKLPKPMNDQEKSKLLQDYRELYTTGAYDRDTIETEMKKKGYSQQDLDQFTIKTDTANLGFGERQALEESAGNDFPTFTAMKDYFGQQYFSEEAGYAPVDRQMGETMLAESVVANIAAVPPALAKLFNENSVFGKDALEWKANIDTINEKSKGAMGNLASQGPALALEALAPTSWLGKAETAKQALIMSTKVSAASVPMMAGNMAAEQITDRDAQGNLSQPNRTEIALWSTAIMALPAVIAGGAVLYRGAKVFVPGETSRLAWKYVKKTLTPEELAALDRTVADMDRLGAFANQSRENKLLVAAARNNANLASDMANEIAYNPHAQREYIRLQRAIAGATGKKSVTSAQAARLFQEIADNTKARTTGTNKAVTEQVYNTQMPASDLFDALPANFETLINDMPGLPTKIRNQADRLIKADKDDPISYAMMDELQDALFKYGEDTNNMQAKGLSQHLQPAKDSIAAQTIDIADANALINQAKDADMANKVLQKMFTNNPFGRMFKKAYATGAHNLDPILTGKLDVGETSRQLGDFLNALSPQQRGAAEELIIDAFAQGFEGSTAAAETFRIADFGGGGKGKQLANSINVIRNTNLTSPDAKSKAIFLELMARNSEFDGMLNSAILNSPAGDIAAEHGLTQSIGFGIFYKTVLQPAMRFFAKRFVEGTAYRTQMRKILTEANYASKMLGDQPLDFADVQAMQGKLFSTMYQSLQPSAYNKVPANVKANSGINFSAMPPKQVRKFMQEYKEFNERRDVLVNTTFFKKVDGKEIAPEDFNMMAEAVKSGRIAFTAGDVIPTGNKDEFALALSSTVRLSNLGALASGKPVPIRRILPRADNKELYAAFPGLSKLHIRGNTKMSPRDQGSIAQTETGQNIIEVNPTQAAETLHTMVGGNKLGALVTSTLHEIGHFLNSLEKLPAGTTPAYWSSKPVVGKRPSLMPGQPSIASNTRRAENEYMGDVGEQMGRISGKEKSTIEGPDGREYETLTYPKPKDMLPVPGKSSNRVVAPIATSAEDRAALNKAKKDTKPKDAYNPQAGIGIDINSKMKTALVKIMRKRFPNTQSARVDIDSLKKYLINEGVSKKEIDLMTTQLAKTKKDPRVDTLKDLGLDDSNIGAIVGPDNIVDKNKVDILDILGDTYDNEIRIADISESKYKNISKSFNPTDDTDITDYKVRGFSTERDLGVQDYHNVGDTKGNMQLGWSRGWSTTAPDGQEAHVLGEFQSDIAQGDNKAKYPIDYSDFKKLAIVDGIDQTIQKGMNKMIIPIDRSGSLHGSGKISEMYAELNKGILPKIRRQLDKAGLKIDVKKVTTKLDNFEARQRAIIHAQTDLGADPEILEDWLKGFRNKNNAKLHEALTNLYAESGTDPKNLEVLRTNKYDSHFEIDIEPKYKIPPKDRFAFMKQYKRDNEKQFKDLTEFNLVKIDRRNFSLEDEFKLDEVYGDSPELDEVDVFFDEEGSQYVSKRLLDKAGVKPRFGLYEHKINEGQMDEATVNSTLQDLDAYDLGYRHPRAAEATQGVLELKIDRAVAKDTGLVLNPTEEFDLKQAKSVEEMHKYVMDKWPDTGNELWEDFNEAYKKTYGKEGKFKEDVAEQTKVRWDMLGVVGALGLSSEMETLKNSKEQ